MDFDLGSFLFGLAVHQKFEICSKRGGKYNDWQQYAHHRNEIALLTINLKEWPGKRNLQSQQKNPKQHEQGIWLNDQYNPP